MQRLVRKRCVVQFAGYETVDSTSCHHRFVREMARFHQTWNIDGTASAPEVAADGLTARFDVHTRGPNWRVTTDFHYFRWDDFVTADRTRGDSRRIPSGLAALAEFILTGTVFRYLWWAWRFALFFLCPAVFIAGMIWLSLGLAHIGARPMGLPPSWPVRATIAVVLFGILWRTLGHKFELDHALDLWSFTRSFVHRTRPGLEQRLDHFARELGRLVRESDADEIVVHGLSLGAALALVVVDRALKLDPDLANGRRLNLVTTGSWVVIAALHPASGWLRAAVGRVVKAPAIYWVEFQSLTDPVNFYKVDPVVALGMPRAGMPVLKIIRNRAMLSEATYRRFRFNFLRIHRQTVMGNEQRYYYDYHMLCCGPLPLAERIEKPHEALSDFAADGALLTVHPIDSPRDGDKTAMAPATAAEPLL